MSLSALALCGLGLLAPAWGAGPRVAVVIDDMGLNYPKTPADAEWMAIDWPITFAVMPESPRTKAAAREVKAAGHELIIHFPIDPFLFGKAYEFPKAAARPQDVEKVRRLLEKSCRDIPGAAGLNNHQSFKATKNRPLMDALMKELKPKGLYFLDSRVSPKTVAWEAARGAGLRSVVNNVFLEEPGHYNDRAWCVRILRRAAALARKRGSAVAIGHHYFRGTLDCLKGEVPRLRAEGVEFVFASALAR